MTTDALFFIFFFVLFLLSLLDSVSSPFFLCNVCLILLGFFSSTLLHFASVYDDIIYNHHRLFLFRQTVEYVSSCLFPLSANLRQTKLIIYVLDQLLLKKDFQSVYRNIENVNTLYE